MNDKNINRVYLCYTMDSFKSKTFDRFVHEFKEKRHIYSFNTWMGGEERNKGSIKKIPEGIRWANFILFLLTENSAKNKYLKNQFEFAYKRQFQGDLKILSVKMDNLITPDYLKDFPYIDLINNYKSGLELLFKTVEHSEKEKIISFDLNPEQKRKNIITISNEVSKKLIEHYIRYPDELKKIDRRRFEELIAELFYGFNYSVGLTGKTRDGGYDIIAVKNDEVKVKYLIECKRPDIGNYISVEPVRTLYGVKNLQKATKAILATTAHFSPEALVIFNEHSWELEPRDFNGIMEWFRLYLQKK